MSPDLVAVEEPKALTPAQLEAQLARERAAVAEPEPGERPEPEQPEEPERPEVPDKTEEPAQPEELEQPAAPLSERELEQGARKLEQEGERHAKAVRRIMGAEAEALEPCPLCWTPGFVWPPGTIPYEPDQVAAVHRTLGELEQPELRDAPDAQRCDSCDGWGAQLTHSRVPGQETKPCKACTGTGWRPVLEQPQPVANGNGEPLHVPALPPPGFGLQTPPDQWGRPFGHRHYGTAPADVI